jgi:NADPH:quinone reductase-like Zn-dependent oxidoreductase
MKAWILARHGDPHAALELRDVPDPIPASDQLLIAAEGFGLNYADLMAVRGLYREAPPPPCVLGYEVVGRVARCGHDAPQQMLGKRVVAFTRFGGQAELVAVDHLGCVEIPDDLPFGEAAALATQGCTAWYAARLLCPLRTGDRVLVHTAAGGVGQLLVQLAVDAGCEVFAVVGSAQKASFAKSIGAAHVFDRSGVDYAAAIREIMHEGGLDASFNAVGGSTFKKDLNLLGSGGRLVLFGGAERGSGSLSALRFVWRMGLVVPVMLMMQSRSLLGLNMLRIGEHKPDVLAECLRNAVDACRQGILRPHVHATYASAQLPDAYLALASGKTVGKVAVRW